MAEPPVVSAPVLSTSNNQRSRPIVRAGDDRPPRKTPHFRKPPLGDHVSFSPKLVPHGLLERLVVFDRSAGGVEDPVLSSVEVVLNIGHHSPGSTRVTLTGEEHHADR